MQLIVLSAGKGSRLPDKFRNKPKCLVELNSKPLLHYNKKFFSRFKSKFIVTGFKQSKLKKIAKEIGFESIFNKNFSSTNMVFSLFLTKKFIKEDVIVVYGDVIFNNNVYDLLRRKKNILPVNINWFKNWKKRMPLIDVYQDAENIISKDNILLEIGSKIEKRNLPKYQFMGIIKFKKEDFFKCYEFFKKIKNKKIDMTTFLNLCILNKIIRFKVEEYSSYWYEIDTISDHKFAEMEINKW